MLPVDLYLQVRAIEGRLYEDEAAARLPDTSPDDPLAGEWRQRAASSGRLARYLADRRAPASILEIGCGNGWLSARLAARLRAPTKAHVTGLDLPSPELAQAARLFSKRGTAFLAADIFHAPFPRPAFDAVVLASAIQYFPDLPALLEALRPLLNPGGEIHILDSPLYAPAELPAARERTQAYYAGLGFPGMARHYFHHPVSALDGFNPRWLYRPQGLANRLARLLGRVDSPFAWVCVH